jgi:hypothetical protein
LIGGAVVSADDGAAVVDDGAAVVDGGAAVVSADDGAAVLLETDFVVVVTLVVVLFAVGRIILHGTAGTHKFRLLSAASNPLAMNARRRSGSPFIVIVTVC